MVSYGATVQRHVFSASLERKVLVLLVPSISAECRYSPWTLESEKNNEEKIGKD